MAADGTRPSLHPAPDTAWAERLRAEALLIWPLSLGALVVYMTFIGPLILGAAGVTGGSSAVERVLAFGGSQRGLVIAAGVVLLIGGLLLVAAEPVQRAVARGGMVAYLALKFAMAIPFFVVLMMLLQTVLVPINYALSGR